MQDGLVCQPTGQAGQITFRRSLDGVLGWSATLPHTIEARLLQRGSKGGGFNQKGGSNLPFEPKGDWSLKGVWFDPLGFDPYEPPHPQDLPSAGPPSVLSRPKFCSFFSLSLGSSRGIVAAIVRVWASGPFTAFKQERPEQPTSVWRPLTLPQTAPAGSPPETFSIQAVGCCAQLGQALHRWKRLLNRGRHNHVRHDRNYLVDHLCRVSLRNPPFSWHPELHLQFHGVAQRRC